jgi:hypothetical protein
MKCIAFIGQSLAQAMFQVSVNPPTPLACTYLWNGSNWGAVTGNGAITYANAVSAKLARANCDPTVRLYNAAVGGNGLLAENAASAHAYWLDTTSTGPLQGLYNQVAAGGYMPDLLEWNGCQQDYCDLAHDANLSNSISAGMASLYSMILAKWGLASAQLPIKVWVPGKASYGTVASQWVMDGLIRFATTTAGASLGPSYYDLNYLDGTHLDAAGYATCGQRGALDTAGPQIIGVDRAGSRLLLNLKFNGGKFIASQLTNGFGVWSEDFTITMPIAYVRSVGERIELDMGAHPTYGNNPPWRVRVGYQWTNAIDASWPAFDDQPMPLTPLPVPLLSTS